MCELIRIHDYSLWFTSIIIWFTWTTRRVCFFFVLLQTMASRSGIYKLTLPTDIGDEESYHQEIIEGKLLKCYAEEVSTIISMLVLENCEGCLIHHPSQRQHDCLMMEDEQEMWLYFDTALEKVSEAKVVETFVNSLQDLKPTVNRLELLKYTRLEKIVLHEE